MEGAWPINVPKSFNKYRKFNQLNSINFKLEGALPINVPKSFNKYRKFNLIEFLKCN